MKKYAGKNPICVIKNWNHEKQNPFPRVASPRKFVQTLICKLQNARKVPQTSSCFDVKSFPSGKKFAVKHFTLKLKLKQQAMNALKAKRKTFSRISIRVVFEK